MAAQQLQKNQVNDIVNLCLTRMHTQRQAQQLYRGNVSHFLSQGTGRPHLNIPVIVRNRKPTNDPIAQSISDLMASKTKLIGTSFRNMSTI